MGPRWTLCTGWTLCRVPGAASYSGPRHCNIPWSQVLPHTLVPSTASYPGPRYCLIPWSQVLPHTLVPSAASFSGPRWTLCRVPSGPWVGSKKSKLQNGPTWAPMNFGVHMDPKMGPYGGRRPTKWGLGAKPPEKQNLVTWSRWNCQNYLHLAMCSCYSLSALV